MKKKYFMWVPIMSSGRVVVEADSPEEAAKAIFGGEGEIDKVEGEELAFVMDAEYYLHDYVGGKMIDLFSPEQLVDNQTETK